MRSPRPIVLVALACACGSPGSESTPAPSTAPASTAPAATEPIAPAAPAPATPTAEPVLPLARPLGPGVPLADAASARAAVFSCHRDIDDDSLDEDCLSPLWPRGILLVSASEPRNAVCEATHGTPQGPTHWACDTAISRCEGDHEVYLFAPTSGQGRVLTAIVGYAAAPIPTEEASEVRAVLAERDRICELLDAVETDPTPYFGDAFDVVSTHETDDGGRRPAHHVTCGAEAREAARAAVEPWGGPVIECGRFDCYDPSEVGNAADRLHAERDEAGHLWILASWSGLVTDAPPFGGVRAAIAARGCSVAHVDTGASTTGPASTPLLATAFASDGSPTYVLLAESQDEHRPDDDGHGEWAVSARPGATPDGRAVRVYGESTFCDGRLGTPVTLSGRDVPPYVHAVAAPVEGCTTTVVGRFAVIAPPPATTQLVRVAADAPEARDVVAAARAAAVSLAHADARQTWRVVDVWRQGDSLYAEVAGPDCCPTDDPDCSMEGCEGDACVAVAMARSGAAPVVVLRRPAHWPWDEPSSDASFSFGAIRDLDGDGAIEIEEVAGASGSAMTRLVRVGAHPPGDVVWFAESHPLDGDFFGPFRPPAPLGSTIAR